MFTEVAGLGLPYLVSQMHLAVFFEANVAEVGTQKSIQVRLQEEDGEVVLSTTHVHVVPLAPRRGTQPSFNLIFPFVDILFEKPGHYEFVVLVREDAKATLPIYANEPVQQGQGGTP